MRPRTWAGLVAGLGLLLVGSAVVHLALEPESSLLHRATVVVLIGGSGVALLYGGYWHATRSVVAGRYLGILGWTAATAVLFAGVGVVTLYIGSRRVLPVELAEALHMTASVGVATGLFVGTTHARAVSNAEAAARAAARADALAAERERAERLNDLLRHYVLNGVNVITGHVDRIRPTTPEDKEAALDAVHRRARSMATLVEHVNALLAVERDATTSTTVDLAATVESVADAADGDAAMRVRTPDASLPVLATGTLDDALDLLLDAVDAVTERGGEITVACEDGATNATVTVTAAPVDLPEHIDQALFEPVGDVGLEFYLSRRLIEDYGDLSVDDASDALRIELHIERPG